MHQAAPATSSRLNRSSVAEASPAHTEIYRGPFLWAPLHIFQPPAPSWHPESISLEAMLHRLFAKSRNPMSPRNARCTMHNAFAWQSRRGVQRYCGVQRCDTVQRCGTQCDGRGGAWCCREELRAMQSRRTFPMVSSFCLQVAETHAVAIKKTGLIRTFCALKLIPVPVG